MQNKVLSVRRAKPNTLRPCRRVAASFNERLEPTRLALPVYSYACRRAAQAQRYA